jgi:nitrite reductase/ring-hydroxylating ferredoxin subunit
MTAKDENALLTQTGRGTPCGELMRRYWQPAALSEELAADKPLPVTILGEELIMFRDGAGNPALIGRYCAHQGVDMIYGCVEPDGLRCMYHGWLFDNCGKVLLRGDWLPEKERRWDVGQAAYPCSEVGGIIFTYMAKSDRPPLPIEESRAARFEGSAPKKDTRGENYLQSLIGDSEAPFSTATCSLPNLLVSLPSSDDGDTWLRWYVPVDDNSHVVFTLRYPGASQFVAEPCAAFRQALFAAIEAPRGEAPIKAATSAKD